MATLVRACAAVGMALGAWLSFGALAAVTGNGPAGRVGILPSGFLLVGLLVLAVAGVAAARRSVDRLWPLCFLLVLVVPWLPGRVPSALLMWVGPLALLIWLAVALAQAASAGLPKGLQRVGHVLSEPRRAMIVAACLAFVVYAAAAHRLHGSGLIPGGDEPHYLIVTQSLLLDGDLRIENNHDRSDYRDYIGIPLKPDFLRRGVDREIYSIHAPGLPALLVPAFAAAGYAGAVWCLALIAAVGTALAWHAGLRLTGSPTAAWFGWAAIACSTSFLFHAFAIYPDATASVVFLATVWALTFRLTPLAWFGLGSAIALLPWLHTRFAVIAVMLGLCAVERLLRRPDRLRNLAAFSIVPVAGAVAWFGFFWVIYGTPNPAVPYGGRSPTTAAFMGRGLVGLLFDQQFGLVAYAPVYLVAFTGLGLMLAGRERAVVGGTSAHVTALQILAVSVPYACVAAGFPMWWAGASAPARFLVPLLLPLALPAAVAWNTASRRATRAWALALLACSVALAGALVAVDGGRLAFNARDGYARFWDWASPLVDVSLALPSLFRHAPGEALLRVLAWILALVVAWLAVRAFDAGGRRSAGALALAALVAGWLGVAVALSFGWAREPVSATRPTASATRLLRSYDARIHRWAVRYAGSTAALVPLSAATAARALDGLQLDWESRQPARPGHLASLGPLPAGDYRVRFELAGASDGTLAVAVGRHDTALERWDLRGLRPGTHERLVHLPVSVVGLVVRVEPPSDGAVTNAALAPASLPARQSVSTPPARQALRAGTRSAFLFNEGAYFEPSGFWLRPGRPALVAFATGEGPAAVRLAARNAPVPNTLAVRAGSWQESFQLAAGEERVIDIPARSGQEITVVELLAERGFQPSLVDPSNRDNRWLGCWVEMR